MIKPTYAIAAHVSARSRHSRDWIQLTILIPKTDLTLEYWGQGIARNHVTSELNKLGLNSLPDIHNWVTDEYEFLKGDKNSIHLYRD
ncbi:hypothetical protein [Vibrio sp. Evd11]|uniref:hypothetical protein n=1 Tax=Vibrio sp. Evd11 TaxID=1207404 RepID=UPI000EFA383C|nr:hypothetical protein [Vibrio sp. Evd11]